MYKNLKSELKRKGITYKELAEKLGMNISTLSDKLKGKTALRFGEAIYITQNVFCGEFKIDYLFKSEFEKNEDVELSI